MKVCIIHGNFSFIGSNICRISTREESPLMCRVYRTSDKAAKSSIFPCIEMNLPIVKYGSVVGTILLYARGMVQDLS